MKASNPKVAIVGAGFLGSIFAYALMMSGLASEIVFTDVNREKAEGEAMGLIHYYGVSDVYLGLPVVVNKNRIERVLEVFLNAEEIEGLRNSARVLKDIISSLPVVAGGFGMIANA